MPIDFTSSGTTYERPARNACPLAPRVRKIVARGLAPY